MGRGTHRRAETPPPARSSHLFFGSNHFCAVRRAPCAGAGSRLQTTDGRPHDPATTLLRDPHARQAPEVPEARPRSRSTASETRPCPIQGSRPRSSSRPVACARQRGPQLLRTPAPPALPLPIELRHNARPRPNLHLVPHRLTSRLSPAHEPVIESNPPAAAVPPRGRRRPTEGRWHGSFCAPRRRGKIGGEHARREPADQGRERTF